jgi:hypothetical protein
MENEFAQVLLVHGYASVLSMLVFRSFPFVAYVFVAKRLAVRFKLISVAVYGALVCALFLTSHSASQIVYISTLTTTYFALMALSTYHLSFRLERGELNRGTLFLLFAFFFVLIPALAVPKQISPYAQLFGWEMMFSALIAIVSKTAARTDGVPGHNVFFFCW